MHKILVYLHTIHLLKSSTCFEHYPAHLQEVYFVIVYMQPLVPLVALFYGTVFRFLGENKIVGGIYCLLLQGINLNSLGVPQYSPLNLSAASRRLCTYDMSRRLCRHYSYRQSVQDDRVSVCPRYLHPCLKHIITDTAVSFILCHPSFKQK